MSVFVLSVHQDAMQNKLISLLPKDEKYRQMFFGSMKSATPALFSYCVDKNRPKIGSSNVNCYIGVTEKHLMIVALSSLDVLKTSGGFRIPLKDIHIVTRGNIFQCMVDLGMGKEHIRLSVPYSVLGSDLKKQKASIQAFCAEHETADSGQSGE
jgi:hypothetical protein